MMPPIVIRILCTIVLMSLTACSGEKQSQTPADASKTASAASESIDSVNSEQSQAVVLLRGLPTLDTIHSVAIVEGQSAKRDYSLTTL